MATLKRLNEELFPDEGESIQQKLHSVDCGTPMNVRAPHDGLKHVCEVSLYIHQILWWDSTPLSRQSHLSLEKADTNFFQSLFLRMWFGLQGAD